MTEFPPYPWQNEIWRHLNGLLKQGRLPHAMLIHGKEGLGKLALAKAFAQRLFCKNPKDNKPCGHCKDCLLMQSEAGHPDLNILAKEGKLGIIKIEQVRDLMNLVNQTSLQGGYRVIIIDSAHAMNQASANALLKSLEEPGQNCIFILLSHEPQLILPTIRSRCQQIKLLAEAPINTESAAQQQNFVMKLLAPNNPISLTQEYTEANLTELIDYMSLIVADLIKIKLNQADQIENKDTLQKMAERLNLKALYDLLDQCYDWHRQSQLKISLNQQLFMEEVFIKWNALFYANKNERMRV